MPYLSQHVACKGWFFRRNYQTFPDSVVVWKPGHAVGSIWCFTACTHSKLNNKNDQTTKTSSWLNAVENHLHSCASHRPSANTVIMFFCRYRWWYCYELLPAKEQTLRPAVILEVCARDNSSSACEERLLSCNNRTLACFLNTLLPSGMLTVWALALSLYDISPIFVLPHVLISLDLAGLSSNCWAAVQYITTPCFRKNTH